MLNYIKSECYRAFHSKIVYITAGLLAGLVLLYHMILYLFQRYTPGFRYGTTSFSFSNLVSSPMIYCYLAFLIVAVLYESNNKNGTHKNSVAFGISRTSLFIGKCTTSLITAFIILISTLAVYLISAFLLLEQKGPVTVTDLFLEIPAVSLVAVSALILGVFFLEFFDKTTTAILTWFVIMLFLPKIILYLGMKIDFLWPIALWLPANFFSVEMYVNMENCMTVWDTVEGMMKCLICGGVSVLLFGTVSIFSLGKKEL
ncbi:MAG: ABC transporter permease [Lachnospiraceae bacterium]|nr:ABC transporter permease [Lachnospiraceae bacterium]